MCIEMLLSFQVFMKCSVERYLGKNPKRLNLDYSLTRSQTLTR